MQHEPQTVGNSRGEIKSEEQARMHSQGHERQSSLQQPLQQPVEPTEPQVQSERESSDATVGWNSGNYAVITGRCDSPLTPEMARVAGIGPAHTAERFTAHEPGLRDAAAGGHLTGAPDCSEGNWNAEAIFRGGK